MVLVDKVAVVYGAGGPIGAAIATAFAREGAQVHLAGRSRAHLDTVAKTIGAAGVAELDARTRPPSTASSISWLGRQATSTCR